MLTWGQFPSKLFLVFEPRQMLTLSDTIVDRNWLHHGWYYYLIICIIAFTECIYIYRYLIAIKLSYSHTLLCIALLSATTDSYINLIVIIISYNMCIISELNTILDICSKK